MGWLRRPVWRDDSQTDESLVMDGPAGREGEPLVFLRVMLALGWVLGTAAMMYGALVLDTWAAPGEPTVRTLGSGIARILQWAAGLAAGAPLAALLLAWWGQDRQAARRWTVALAVGLLTAGLILAYRQTYLHRLHQCVAETRAAGGQASDTSCVENADVACRHQETIFSPRCPFARP
ncbi:MULTISPECIES: hypothetical protein [Frankia]|uniref:Uncharacterized protein n=1 Tax=Frankia alni (strain DSM 45986 / CECT 9034 / ACN14a) TaxID=326424 RepID=Q0RJM5_FRAAA|nr:MULTISPECIES: hypothetical protein [Frankia]CAJ62287.1 hypothetical protein; putative membrane protein [Frankia alni ACN14a]